MKKLLVFGVSGLTGYKIAKISSDYEFYGTYNSRQIKLPDCQISKLDLSNFDHVSKVMSEIKPDITINTTALHNVDFCEEYPEKSQLINHLSVENIKNICNKIGCKLVHISTDYVFDGNKNSPYSESDLPNPVSKYGESKLAGELTLNDSPHVVLRPSVVYGWTPMELAGKTSSSGKPINFAMWLLTKLHDNESLKIVTDQFATATLADSLAESALKIANTNTSGLYHIAGLSCENRHEFSIKLAKEFGYDENLIQPTDSSQFKQKAKRPSYSCLDCNKAIKEFDLNLHTTENALKIMRAQVEIEAPHLLGK